MCQLGQVSRAGLYRFDPEREQPDDDLDLRHEIQRIALDFPWYGRPRITAELKRRGWKVNHKRVARILREDNLLCLRRRKFVPTTDSRHGFPIYPNLAGGTELTGIPSATTSFLARCCLDQPTSLQQGKYPLNPHAACLILVDTLRRFSCPTPQHRAFGTRVPVQHHPQRSLPAAAFLASCRCSCAGAVLSLNENHPLAAVASAAPDPSASLRLWQSHLRSPSYRNRLACSS
jgi:hypothetical protein